MTAPGTIIECRVKGGQRILGAQASGGTGSEFSCQAYSIQLNPNYEDDGDDLETLCGAELPAGKKETWTLSGTLVQDFDAEAGMVRYLRNHAMEIVEFM